MCWALIHGIGDGIKAVGRGCSSIATRLCGGKGAAGEKAIEVDPTTLKEGGNGEKQNHKDIEMGD